LSLHDGVTWFWWDRRIVSKPSARSNPGGAMGAGCDGSLGGALLSTTRGGLEVLFDDAVNQEGERGEVDVRLHAAVGPLIDQPHVENILDSAKARSTSDSSSTADRVCSSVWMAYLPGCSRMK
jgi:hypothetical protein